MHVRYANNVITMVDIENITICNVILQKNLKKRTNKQKRNGKIKQNKILWILFICYLSLVGVWSELFLRQIKAITRFAYNVHFSTLIWAFFSHIVLCCSDKIVEMRKKKKRLCKQVTISHQLINQLHNNNIDRLIHLLFFFIQQLCVYVWSKIIQIKHRTNIKIRVNFVDLIKFQFLAQNHFVFGQNETISIDRCTHSS